MVGGELPHSTEGQRARYYGRHHMNRFLERTRDCAVHVVGQNSSRVLEQLFRVGPAPDERSKPSGLGVRNSLASFCGVGIPLDLLIDSIAQAKSLVAELLDIFLLR